MSPPEPPWLLRLREGLFAALPETDEAFVYEGTPYICRRRLDYGDSLIFHEAWLDPQTYQPKRTWRQEVEAGAFAGNIPETVFRQQLARLLEWLALARPHGVVRERPVTLTPQRFAHQGRTRRT